MNDNDKPKGPTVVIAGTGRAAMEAIAALNGAALTPAEITDNPPPPRLTGPHGRAWLCDIARGMEILKPPPEFAAITLAQWVVEAPWAHPVWHSYIILLQHLRPVPGLKPPKILRPQATHEMMVGALSADYPRNELIETGIVKTMLHPLNFVGQFIEVTDDLARERVEHTVKEILDGKLNPDTDFRHQWFERYGDWMHR